MYKIIISVVVIASIFVTGGCAMSPLGQATSMPMLDGAKHHVGGTRVYIGQDPSNNYNFMVYHGNSAQQYGLLGVLVESFMHNQMEAERQKQESLMVPVRTALFKYHFGSKVREESEKQLKSIEWLKVTDVSKEPSLQQRQLAQLKAATSEDTILIIDAMYTMNPEFTVLTIIWQVGLYPREGLLLQMAKSRELNEDPALYRNRFVFEFPYDEDYVGNKTAALGWSQDEGYMLHRALDYGIAELARLVALDLQNQLRPGEVAIGNRIGRTVTVGGITGTLLEEKDHRVIVRLDNGTVHALRRPGRVIHTYTR